MDCCVGALRVAMVLTGMLLGSRLVLGRVLTLGASTAAARGSVYPVLV